MKRLLAILLFALPLFADDVARLHAIFDRAWEFELKENPLMATSVGRHEFNDRLPAIAPADLKRQADFARGILGELKAMDRAKLPRSEEHTSELQSLAYL